MVIEYYMKQIMIMIVKAVIKNKQTNKNARGFRKWFDCLLISGSG